MENGYVESFNGRFRDECLNENWFSSLADEAQLGHSKMSTTLEIYTLPMPEQQRATVEKLSVLMADDGRKAQNPEGLPLASEQIQ